MGVVQENKTSRSSNLELFRIIMMFSIVAHHYVVNSGLIGLVETNITRWNTYFLYIFGMWGKIGINCFVLITGYFMCKSQITVRKFLKLFLEVEFYNIVIYSIFALTNYVSITYRDIFFVLNPIGSIGKDFVSCFLVFYLLIPFLTLLVNSLSQRQHQLLLIICFIFFVLWHHLPYMSSRIQYNYVSWFCFIFFIASYIRFYGNILCRFNKNGIVVLGVLLLAVFSVVASILQHPYGSISDVVYQWVVDCDAVLAVVSSVALFEWFKDLQIPQSKVINWISGGTFGVLLIHANSNAMRQWLWRDVCENVQWFDSTYLPLHALGCVAAIFIICVLIDRLRIIGIEKPLFKFLDKKFSGIQYWNKIA